MLSQEDSLEKVGCSRASVVIVDEPDELHLQDSYSFEVSCKGLGFLFVRCRQAFTNRI